MLTRPFVVVVFGAGNIQGMGQNRGWGNPGRTSPPNLAEVLPRALASNRAGPFSQDSAARRSTASRWSPKRPRTTPSERRFPTKRTAGACPCAEQVVPKETPALLKGHCICHVDRSQSLPNFDCSVQRAPESASLHCEPNVSHVSKADTLKKVSFHLSFSQALETYPAPF